MLDLEMHENFHHHYIIGVIMGSMIHKNPGKMELKYGPIYYTHDDLKRVKDSIILCNDKIYRNIYKMTKNDIYRANNCTELLMSMYGLKHSAQMNHATLHHFMTEEEIPNSGLFFKNLVEVANDPNSEERKKLHEARITSY